jgi:hypothetical protein
LSSFIDANGVTSPLLIAFELDRLLDFSHVVTYAETCFDPSFFWGDVLCAPGDTPASIAKRHKLTLRELIDYNLEFLPGITTCTEFSENTPVRVSRPQTSPHRISATIHSWRVVYCTSETTPVQLANIDILRPGFPPQAQHIVDYSVGTIDNIHSVIPPCTAIRIARRYPYA